MNPNYPSLHIAYEAGAAIEHTMLIIATIAAAGLIWLWLARFEFPRLFPATRAILAVAFFVSLAFMLVLR